MKRLLVALWCALAFLCWTGSASANFFNGGFEFNSFAGWHAEGSCRVTNAGWDPRTLNALPTAALGNHSARVGDEYAFGYIGTQYSFLSQKETVGASDRMDLYFAWAAVGLVPTNDPHGEEGTPYFKIDVNWYHGALVTPLHTEEHVTGDIGAITPGWVRGAVHNSSLGLDDPGVWYYRPWTTFHFNLGQVGIQAGDQLEVVLTTRDCSRTGHASYAYLDGFGTTPPPIPAVPEPGSLQLLGFGLAGSAGALAIFRRKR
jgi:hypothetical protein